MSLLTMRRKLDQLTWVLGAFAAVFILGIFLSFNYNSASTAGSHQAGALFARINGQDVPMSRFASLVQGTRDQFAQFSSGSPITVDQQQEWPRYAYDRLIEEYAQAAAAEAEGISVSSSDAEAEARRQNEQIIEQIGKGSKPEEVEQMRSYLNSNIDVESKRRELLGQRLRDKISKEVRPVEVKVAHVLIKTDKRSDAAALKLAQDVARQARAGVDFAKLAQKYSEDEGSKVNGGMVGWASAMPPGAPTGKDARPEPEAATSFVPEFTAASLRLPVGQVSDPVKSTFGWHVIKALQTRDYQPKDKESEKDPKKRADAIEQYKSSAASQIANGIFSAYKTRLESTIQPHSAWLKGYLAEQKSNASPMPVQPDKSGKTLSPGKAEEIRYYREALDKNDPAAGPGLAYKVIQLYLQNNQPQQALELLEKWTKRTGDPQMYLAQGEAQEKLGRRMDALDSYKNAMDRVYNNPTVLNTVADKFKGLNRNDLAEQARKKQSQQLAKQAEEQKRREAEQKAAQEKTVGTVTVKTGDVDPKTGKPKILSVTQGEGDGKGGKKAEKKPAAEEKPATQGAVKKDGDVVGEVTVKTGPIDPKTGKPTILSVTPSGGAKGGKAPAAEQKTPGKP